MSYTSREYAMMHFIYGECGGNARAAARKYAERYPNASSPDHRVFIRVHNSYMEGIIPGSGRIGRPQHHLNDEVVLREIENNPSTSTRAIERTTGIPKSTVQRILKQNNLHPFHLQRVQALLPRDYPKRVEFCQIMIDKSREDPDFVDKILWSDESSFKQDGYLNMHNIHNWQEENPHLIREGRSQYQFKINLWCGILNGQIIGPFELPDTINSENYLEFLENRICVLLDDIPLALLQTMWFQQDGCPAHYGRNVRSFLDRTFSERWMVVVEE